MTAWQLLWMPDNNCNFVRIWCQVECGLMRETILEFLLTMDFSAIIVLLSVKYILCKVEMDFKKTWEQMACRWRFALSI